MFDGKVKHRTVNFHSGNKKRDLTKEQLVEENRKLREARAVEKKRNSAATKVQTLIRRFLHRRRCTRHFKAQLQAIDYHSSTISLRLLSQASFVFARQSEFSADDIYLIATLCDTFTNALPVPNTDSLPTVHSYQVTISAFLSLLFRCLSTHRSHPRIPYILHFLSSLFVTPHLDSLHCATFRLVSSSLYSLYGMALDGDAEISNICSRYVDVAWSPTPTSSFLGTSYYFLQRSYYYFAKYVLPSSHFVADTVRPEQWTDILAATHQFPKLIHRSPLTLYAEDYPTSSGNTSLHVITHWLRFMSQKKNSVMISSAASAALFDAIHDMPVQAPQSADDYDSDADTPITQSLDTIAACVVHHRRVICVGQANPTPQEVDFVKLMHGAPVNALVDSYISSRCVDVLAPLSLLLVREVDGDRRNAILNSAAFGPRSTTLVSHLWSSVQDSDVQKYSIIKSITSYIEDLVPSPASTSPLLDEALVVKYLHNRIYPLYFLLSTLHYQLQSLDDSTFMSPSTKSLPLSAFVDLIIFLRDLLYHMYYVHPVVLQYASTGVVDRKHTGAVLSVLQLLRVGVDLFNQLCIRNERLKFMPTDDVLWRLGDVSLKNSDHVSSSLECTDPRLTVILRELPQVVPFRQRVEIFEALRQSDRSHDHSAQGILGGAAVRIERSDILGSGFREMGALKAGQLKQRVRITFVSEAGVEEPGIDGGGLYKEFMDLLFRDALSASRRLFSVVPKTQMLTPNPAGRDQLAYYNFLGKMLGKAVYEGVLVETMFCVPFWNRILGRHNLIDDLKEIDDELYASLIGLRNDFIAGKSSVADLGLTFEIASRTEKGVVTVPLLPNGGSIVVTDKNVISYVYLYAHYKLNRETNPQCRAFLTGFQEIIPQTWIQLFSPREMLTVVGGDTDRGVDLNDLMANCTYSGGYHPSQPYIQAFWSFIASFDKNQLGEFLKFVTSCSRQPLLGFKQLHPPFNICKVPAKNGEDEASRLPQASACFNQFKLPQYDTIEEMTEKVMYAIMSKSGFEMS